MGNVASIKEHLDRRASKLVDISKIFITRRESTIRETQAILRRLEMLENNVNINRYGEKSRRIKEVGETQIELYRAQIRVVEDCLGTYQNPQLNRERTV